VSKLLRLTRFGNPILRQKAQPLSIEDIKSNKIKTLIANIRYTNQKREYGMGIAAPQVGKNIALSVIGIKPTPTRPNLQIFEQVIINPTYMGVGRRTGMWEGCQSCGTGKDILYAKTLRYKKIRATWYDESAKHHDEELDGFVAHVFQHETDHLNGILFVDKVNDPTTYMMADEYQKRIVGKNKN
jgi:peptide deformylase